MVLEELCNLNAVSGDEENVRNFILDKIRPYADEIKIDIMGNLIAYVKGKSSAKKIMIAAHMDEVGLIVSKITDDGYLKFKTVGGIDERILPTKRVEVGNNRTLGVIGLKAIHLQNKSERESVTKVSDLVIDIGAVDYAEAAKKVSVGDYVSFKSDFSSIAEGRCFKGKALDDRCGCAALTELIKKRYCYDVYFSFTVQEEVGTRGAVIAANYIKPDAALVLEATTCSDVSGVKDYLEVTNLGGGAALSIKDNGSYSDVDFTKALYNMAKKKNISVQYKRTTSGGNDARAVQLANGGVCTAALSVPCRYLHSPVGIISKSDFEAVCMLSEEFLKSADKILG